MKRLFLLLSLFFLCTAANAQVGTFIRPDTSTLTTPVQGQTWLFNSTNFTTLVWNGSAWLLTSAPFNNFTATTNPTTSNDHTQGYASGSTWYNTSNSNIYTCVSAATSAAVWIQTNNLGGLSIPLNLLEQGGAAGGQSLIYNSGTGFWAPGSPLISLNNILQTGALIGQTITWNGTNWVPTNTTGGGGGSDTLAIVNKIADFTATTNTLYLVTLTSANVTCTLPDATSCPGQKLLVVLNAGSTVSNFLYFSTVGGQTINASNYWYNHGFAGGTASNTFTFISNGTGWQGLQSGDMLVGLFGGTYQGPVSGWIAMALTGNTVALAPVLQAQPVNSDTSMFGMNAYFVDTSGGNVNMTLPDATQCSGEICSINVAVAGNNVVLNTTGGQLLNNAPVGSFTNLMTVGAGVTFASDGNNWWTIGNTWGGIGP